MTSGQNSQKPFVLNPFFHRNAIRDPDYFFGRQKETSTIISYVMREQSVSVVGTRRIGKSSLLFHLRDPATRKAYGLDDHIAFVFIDCQRMSRLTDKEIYQRLLEEVISTIDASQASPPLPDEPIRFPDFEREMNKLATQGHKFIFLFDEFEALAKNQHLDKNFFTELRGLGQEGHVIYITASQETLYDLSFHDENVLTSPFFNTFATTWLGLMKVEEVRELIKGLAAKVHFKGFDEDDLAFIQQQAGLHPFFIQMVSTCLFEEKRAETAAANPNYDRVRRQFAIDARPHFDYTWQKLSKREQDVLILINKGKLDQTTPEERDRLTIQKCLVHDNQIFSRAFARFVSEQDTDREEPPSPVAVETAERASKQPVSYSPFRIEGEILPQHESIVHQIFADENLESATFQLLSGGYANTGIYRVKRRAHNSRGYLLSKVLKFASAKDVKAEKVHYRKFVEDRLRISYRGGNITYWFPPDIDRLPESQWRYETAATVYPYLLTVGDVVLNFEDVYKNWVRQIDRMHTFSDDDPVKKTLRRLFSALGDWQHRIQSSQRNINLREEYKRLVRKLDYIEECAVNLEKLEINESVRQNPALFRQQKTFTWQGRSFLNPIYWVDRLFSQTGEPEWLEQLVLSYHPGIVHGDLNFRNILVEENDGEPTNLWLIDFANTHQGHPLRDFGTLEAEIKFLLTRVSAQDFQANANEGPPILAFERKLLLPHERWQIDLQDESKPAVCQQNPELFAAWTYVCRVRKEVRRKYITTYDVRPYYLGLLHATLPVIYYTQLSEWQRLYAFLSAALICQKLDELNGVI